MGLIALATGQSKIPATIIILARSVASIRPVNPDATNVKRKKGGGKVKVDTGVFERSGRDTLSERVFYLILGSLLIYGLGGTAIVAYYTALSSYTPSIGAILVLGLAIPIAGIIISVKSDNPLVSFVGYNMVLLPFGVIMSPLAYSFVPEAGSTIAGLYSPEIIFRAFGLTCCITGIMTVLALSHPDWFKNLGGVLFIALTVLLMAVIARIFIPALREFGIIDWAGAVIFTLYIGVDMYRASTVPKTLDNAVDIAISLYLDLINLFLFILRILNNNND